MTTEIDPTRDGCLLCPDCEGKGWLLQIGGGREQCPACEGAGMFHPFLSHEEYVEQIRERHPDAVFVIPGPEEDSP